MSNKPNKNKIIISIDADFLKEFDSIVKNFKRSRTACILEAMELWVQTVSKIGNSEDAILKLATSSNISK